MIFGIFEELTDLLEMSGKRMAMICSKTSDLEELESWSMKRVVFTIKVIIFL